LNRKDAAIKERDTIISRLNQRATDLDSQLFSIEQDNRLKVMMRCCVFLLPPPLTTTRPPP
jgi:hypothetical protein